VLDENDGGYIVIGQGSGETFLSTEGDKTLTKGENSQVKGQRIK